MNRALEEQKWWFLGALTLLAAMARFATLDIQSFHHDEAVTAGRIILPNLFDTLGEVVDSERSPPLYYVLVWPWSKAFGTGEVGLRSLSALIGTLTVPAAFLAGRELAGRASAAATRIGLVTAAFCAFNPYLVWYSQEARSYILMVLFATLALAFFARRLRERSPQALWLWAGASALALLSHYFAAFMIAAQGLWLLWTFRERLAVVLPSVIAVGLVGLALIPLARAQEGEDRSNTFTNAALTARVGEVALNYVASEDPGPLAGSSRVDAIQIFAAVAGGALFLSAVALVSSRASPAEREGAVISAAVAGSAIVVPILLALIGFDFLKPRNVITGLVPILAFAAIGFGGQRAGRLGLVLAGSGCLLFAGVVMAVNVSSEMQREDWRGAAEAMGESDHARVIVTNQNGDDPLSFYLGADELFARKLAAGVKTREIEVLSTTYTVEPPRGFRVVDEQGLAPIFILTRLRADRRRLVTGKDLENVISERSVALIDRPG